MFAVNKGIEKLQYLCRDKFLIGTERTVYCFVLTSRFKTFHLFGLLMIALVHTLSAPGVVFSHDAGFGNKCFISNFTVLYHCFNFTTIMFMEKC